VDLAQHQKLLNQVNNITMAVKKTVTKKPSAKSVGVSMSATPTAEMRKWEIESAMNTLKRADEIRKDMRMMKDVQNLAQEQIKMLGGLVGPGKAPAAPRRKK
jgi:hypothetical protein